MNAAQLYQYMKEAWNFFGLRFGSHEMKVELKEDKINFYYENKVISFISK